MKAREGLVCAACGTLNRPNWEYCARCNEPLEEAAITQPPAPTVIERDTAVPLDEPTDNSALVLVVGLAAFATLSLAAYRYASTEAPTGPDPALFTVATRPPAPREAEPLVGPGSSDFDAGRRLLNSGDHDGAIEALSAAVDADPQNAEYRNVLAHALWRAGDHDQALAEHAEAARLDPRFQAQYARSLDVAGRPEEAVRAYEAVVGENPEAVVLREDLGRLLFRTGAYAEAVPHLEVAVRERPEDPVLAQEFAYSLDQAGQKERAASTYRQVLERAPQAVLTRGLLAETLYEQGRKDEAMKVLQDGLSVTPDAPLLRRQMGSLLERSGKQAEAAAAYREYARLVPNSPDAKTIAERARRLDARSRKP